MRTETDVPRDISVLIKTFPNDALIRFSDQTGKRAYSMKENEPFMGEMRISRVDKSNFWNITQIQAENGFGPLLYDIAIEYATLHGRGLIADRFGPISTEARSVWDKYFHQRHDVDKDPLPEKWIRRGESDEDPTSYSYTKDPERIQKLRSMGRLIER